MQNKNLLCGICFIQYESGDAHCRPIVLNCGHSVCGRCFFQLTNCPFCKKFNTNQYENQYNMRGSVNYQLEHISQAEEQLSHKKQKDLDAIDESYYCLDCKQAYRPIGLSFLQDHHEGHNTVALKGKDMELITHFLWMLQNKDVTLKNKGSLGGFLRTSLFLVEKMLTDYFFISDYTEEFGAEALDSMLGVMIKEGLNSPNFDDQEVMDTFSSLRVLQERLYTPMLLAIKDFGPGSISSLITPEVAGQILQKNTSSVKIPQLDAQVLLSLTHYLMDSAAAGRVSDHSKRSPKRQRSPDGARPLALQPLGKRLSDS